MTVQPRGPSCQRLGTDRYPATGATTAAVPPVDRPRCRRRPENQTAALNPSPSSAPVTLVAQTASIRTRRQPLMAVTCTDRGHRGAGAPPLPHTLKHPLAVRVQLTSLQRRAPKP